MTQLRPITAEDVDALERWTRDPTAGGEFQWFGYRTAHRLRDAVERGETITADGGKLAVVADDGTLVGDVQWFPRPCGPIPGTAPWMIGVIILTEHRRQGHGSIAQQLLAAYLFDHTTAERVEASTDIDNTAEQRALERAGFTREGMLRRLQFRAGGWHDMVIYSKLRGEP